MTKQILLGAILLWGGLISISWSQSPGDFPTNQWVEIRRDAEGARPGSAVRYVPEAGAFFLWGFMNANPDLLQEHPLMEIPEYDMVTFNPADGRWRSQFPKAWESVWSQKLPLAFSPRTYAGITTGSERTVLRSPTDEAGGAPRPDLNIVYDQVVYHPPSQSLIYFTGGLTAAYHTVNRWWSDLAPRHSPPPVLGGALACDPVHDQLVLFGGGHVAEPDPNGKILGYTGTWIYSFRDRDWRRLPTSTQPPPRMNTRLVLDSKNQLLVLFGGDGQSHYLADTWMYDLRTGQWRSSKATAGPEARAGHFTVYDPETGFVVIGGGYNRRDLTDMWAYDASRDRWQRLAGEVPTGFYLTADLDPRERLILLVTSTRKPGDTMSCNILHPVRTTYGFRIEQKSIVVENSTAQLQGPISKKVSPEKTDVASESTQQQAQEKRLASLPENQWVHLADPRRLAPTRTWGSATFDTDRGRILYWGGEHCGYEGNDVDAYDVAAHTWQSGDIAEYPARLWNHGVRLAGVTFQGNPWTVHGRKMYAYDPVSRKLIMTRPIRLTTGYDPQPLRLFPVVLTAEYQSARDALVNPPSSFVKHVTWTYDPDTSKWELLGSTPKGLDALVTTRHGVMGVNVDWPSRLNDAGYLLPWSPSQPPEDKAIYLLDATKKTWKRLSQAQPSPQNLYEQTSLVYDSKRDQIILHGAGKKREELWIFEMAARRWKNMLPQVTNPEGGTPPVCSREAVYIPEEDVFLTYGGSASESQPLSEMWVYEISQNVWRRVEVGLGPGAEAFREANQNRAMVYDPRHNLVLMVLGTAGDEGMASVYALRFRSGTVQSRK